MLLAVLEHSELQLFVVHAFYSPTLCSRLQPPCVLTLAAITAVFLCSLFTGLLTYELPQVGSKFVVFIRAIL